MKRSFPLWLLLLLPLIIIATMSGNFIFFKGAQYSDLLIMHYPNALTINRSLSQFGTIPLWSDQILGGYPFSADPQSGLWYLPMWLVNLLPSAAAFNILIFLHLFLAGVGMFLFLKREGLRDVAALAGGVLFELMPKLWAHFGAGHISLVMAVCLTPWLLLAEKDYQSSGYSLRKMAFPGIVLGLIILSGVVWAPYALLIWISYALAIHFKNSHEGTARQKLQYFLKRLGWVFTQILIGLLISAPVWLPLITFSDLSSRSLMTPADSLLYSMPLSNLLNLFIPNVSGSHEWVIYPGIITLFLIIYLLLAPRKRILTFFWIVLSVIGLLISFGSNLPLIPLLYKLPLFNLLRVPSRFFFIACVGIAILAAFGAERFCADGAKTGKRFRLTWIGFGLFVSSLSIGLGMIKQALSIQFFWPLLFSALSIILIFNGKQLVKHTGIFAFCVTALLLLDVFGVNLMSLELRRTEDVFSEDAAVAEFISNQEGVFRTYSPSYSLQQHSAAVAAIQQTDGINPLPLLNYVDFMESATGIPSVHYSSSLPDFPSAKPEMDNLSYTPDSHLLGLLNVRYVLSEFDLPNSKLSLVTKQDSTFVYENLSWLPRAWVQGESAMIGTSVLSMPQVALSPNRISIQAHGPGLLVLSEISYPGWHVMVDGNAKTLLAPLNLLRGVQLSSGEHHIEFVYQPLDVFIGIGLAVLGWITCIIILLIKPGTNRKAK